MPPVVLKSRVERERNAFVSLKKQMAARNEDRFGLTKDKTRDRSHRGTSCTTSDVRLSTSLLQSAENARNRNKDRRGSRGRSSGGRRNGSSDVVRKVDENCFQGNLVRIRFSFRISKRFVF
jgi:hypothetical protein